MENGVVSSIDKFKMWNSKRLTNTNTDIKAVTFKSFDLKAKLQREKKESDKYLLVIDVWAVFSPKKHFISSKIKISTQRIIISWFESRKIPTFHQIHRLIKKYRITFGNAPLPIVNVIPNWIKWMKERIVILIWQPFELKWMTDWSMQLNKISGSGVLLHDAFHRIRS